MEPLLAGAPGVRAALLEEGGTASTRIHIRRDE
jgi:hypothetical protein